MTLAVGHELGPYEILGSIGVGGPPPLARCWQASSGEISSAFAAERLLRDHVEARQGLEPSRDGPKPSLRMRV